MTDSKKDDEELSEEEIAKRRDEALKRVLRVPPKGKKKVAKKAKKPKDKK